MSSLKNIKSGKEVKPPKLVLYGTPGIGKSTFPSKIPNVIYIPTEDGISHLDVAKFTQPISLDGFNEYLKDLSNKEHDYKCLVIDTIDWFEKLIHKDICKQKNVKEITEIPYGRGLKMALPYWEEMIATLNELNFFKKMTIILLAHSQIKRFDSPETDSYDRYFLDIDQKAAALVTEWADALLFVNYKIYTVKESEKFGQKVYKASGTGQRTMYTENRPAFQAKNRFALPPEIDFSWDELREKILDAYK